MAEDVNHHGPAPDRRRGSEWEAALVKAARAVGPPLLFGLRLWASVCLALFVAFWLELDNAHWAGTSAAIVCQPHLGASLRKGWFRLIGSLVGAVVIVFLTAWFPQNRTGFLLALALWCAACGLVGTLLHNFAAYAAALAGYTAVIIASDELGATGGANGEAFTLAIARVSEIWIGIVCAGVVLAGTDFGGAPRRLAMRFASLSAEIASRFGAALAAGGAAFSETQPVRRELVRQVIALDPVIDEALGESSRLRYHSRVLQAAVGGLFAALAAWRTVAVRLIQMPDDAARQETDAVLRCVPREIGAWMNFEGSAPERRSSSRGPSWSLSTPRRWQGYTPPRSFAFVAPASPPTIVMMITDDRSLSSLAFAAAISIAISTMS
jgi:hypothetical protein